MAKERSKDKKEKKEKKETTVVVVDGRVSKKEHKKEKKDKSLKKKLENGSDDVASKLLETLENKQEKKEKKEKEKKEKTEKKKDADEMDEDVAVEDKAPAVAISSDLLVPFAQPLAEEKQARKVLKCVKKGAKNKCLKRGVKEVVKALRKSPLASASNATTLSNGLVVLAADISPMDVISHLPVLCEDHGIPYIFVSSRAELGAAGATKRPTSVVMVTPGAGAGKKGKTVEVEEGFKESYDETVKLVEAAMRAAPH